jgi:polysaccharide biosynthesis/export protein
MHTKRLAAAAARLIDYLQKVFRPRSGGPRRLAFSRVLFFSAESPAQGGGANTVSARRLLIRSAFALGLFALALQPGVKLRAQGGGYEPTKFQAAAPSAALPADSPTESAYRLRRGDKLSVRFLYHSELNEPSLVVRPDGFISLQMVDDVRAAGLTAAELKAAIERAYAEILLSPVITVSVLEFVAPRVYVSGQVARPGSYALRDGNTLLQAIALAGGFTPAAHRKLVLHARSTGERQLRVAAIDVTRLMAPGSRVNEIELGDGDYVFVPDSKLSKFSRVVEAFSFAVPGFNLQ